MSSIDVSADVHDKVRLLGRALDINEGEVIERLLQSFLDKGTDAKAEVPVSAKYVGVVIEAAFNPKTQSVRILTGPLAGETYSTPSRAAGQAILAVKPTGSAFRNGWYFWRITETGELLKTLRHPAA